MDRPLVIGLILVVYVIYIAIKQKETWKRLSPVQIAGVFLTFLAVIGIGGFILYYGVRFLIAFTESEVLSIIIQFVAAIVIVVVGMVAYNKIVYQLTNGILPIQRKRR